MTDMDFNNSFVGCCENMTRCIRVIMMAVLVLLSNLACCYAANLPGLENTKAVSAETAAEEDGKAVKRIAGKKEVSWYIPAPRLACLGDSILASSFVHYYPESVQGDGKTLIVTLSSDNHILKIGSKIKLTGYGKELGSEIFTVTAVNGRDIAVNSPFLGVATRKFYFKVSCNTFQLKYGYVGQALKISSDAAPLFTATIPATSVGITTRTALEIMDYELMTFADDFDVVLIQLGTNDMGNSKFTVDYVGNMKVIIEKLHGAGKMVIIGNLPPILPSADDAQAYAARIKEANRELEDLGKLYNVPVLDFYSRLAGEDGFAREEYMNDSRHPNIKGYTVMGGVLFSYAEKYFAKSSPELNK